MIITNITAAAIIVTVVPFDLRLSSDTQEAGDILRISGGEWTHRQRQVRQNPSDSDSPTSSRRDDRSEQ
jgi:hypothetical protein